MSMEFATSPYDAIHLVSGAFLAFYINKTPNAQYIEDQDE